MSTLDLSWKAHRPAEGFYTSEVASPRPWPIRTFLPTGYEPKYPYPLIVFFHGHGGNEEQILRLAPKISRRNFISIGLRGPAYLGRDASNAASHGWGDSQHRTLVEDYLLRAVELTRRTYHVHSERIYLAGFAEGAAMAYRLGLTFPEKLAGVVSLNGAMPRLDRPLFRMPEVRNLRVFIGHGIANSRVPLSLARDDYRVLYSAGARALMRTYPTTQRIHPDMLRDLNRWIVDHCAD
jgi:phospholipase/carboxylesterase